MLGENSSVQIFFLILSGLALGWKENIVVYKK